MASATAPVDSKKLIRPIRCLLKLLTTFLRVVLCFPFTVLCITRAQDSRTPRLGNPPS
jgi:hypothetical protein